MLALDVQFSMPPQNNCHNRPKALNLRKPIALKVYHPRRHCIFWQWNLSEINKLHRYNYWSTLTYVTLWSEPVAISTRSLFRGCQQIIKRERKLPALIRIKVTSGVRHLVCAIFTAEKTLRCLRWQRLGGLITQDWFPHTLMKPDVDQQPV